MDVKKENPLVKLIESTNPQEHEDEKASKKKEEYKINRDVVLNPSYRDKFNAVDVSQKAKNMLIHCARKALFHRDGTYYEDMHFINRFTGQKDASQTKMDTWGDKESERIQHVAPNKKMKKAIQTHEAWTYVAVHNHPGSLPPSGDDLEAAWNNKYYMGIVACHDGTVWGYQLTQLITAVYYNSQVAESYEKVYNEEREKSLLERKSAEECLAEAYDNVLKECEQQYGLRWWKA